jgi:hypothetical protein
MAPRAYWKGYLKLSLVTCPIVLYPASSQAAVPGIGDEGWVCARTGTANSAEAAANMTNLFIDVPPMNRSSGPARVVVGKHHQRLAAQLRLEHALARCIEVIAIDMREGLVRASTASRCTL